MISNRKILIAGTIILVIGIILVGYLAGVFLNKTKEESKKKTEVTDAVSVSLTAKGFSPATISVKKGTVITFTNQDTKPHQVASDPHPIHTALPGFVSTALSKGASYSFVFEKTGTYTYHDHLNPLKFNGTVMVTK